MTDLGFDRALITIISAKGGGKSLAAGSYLPPSKVSKVFYHDGENSASRMNENLKKKGHAFGHYYNLDDRWQLVPSKKDDMMERIYNDDLPWADKRQQDALVSYYKFVVQDIVENMTPNEFEVYVHDPVERFEAGMQAWVEQNKAASGWRKDAWGEKWNKGFYPLYYGFFNALYERGIKTIILTAHLHHPWEEYAPGKAKPVLSKVKPRMKPGLFMFSQAMFWLVNEPLNPDGAPAAIVYKERLGDMTPNDDDSWTIKRMLPRRIPHFTWNDVARYLEKGCDLANPKDGETLSYEEQRMIDDAYDDKEMELMILQAKSELAESKITSSQVLGITPVQQARELSAKGMSAQEVAEKLGVALPIIMKWLGGQ